MATLKTTVINNKEIIVYGIIGSFSAALDFIAFNVIIRYTEIYYLFANAISVTIGISSSFFLNRNYNFKVKDKAAKRFAIFYGIGILGLLLSSALLYIFIDVFFFNRILSKLLSIIIVVFFQFLANKYITFRKSAYA